jgi:hypothetical protein
VLGVVVGKLWLRIGKRLIDSRFTSTADQLMDRLHSVEACPRDPDLSFRSIHARCHKNTWFFAVKEFASRSDVVLMDLRGYTARRSGCKTEVNFLFDAVPLARLLFLVDRDNDATAVRQMMRECWTVLSKKSPNLELPSPTVHLFMVCDNDERDMQAILQRLIAMAGAAGAPDVALA